MKSLFSLFSHPGTIILVVLAVCLLAAAYYCAKGQARLAGGGLVLCNSTVGEHREALNRTCDAVIATRWLLVKEGVTPGTTVAVCGAADLPLGVANTETIKIGDELAVLLLGATGITRKVVASEAIAVKDPIYTAANGQVQNEPAVAGTYYLIGYALTAAAGAGAEIEIDPIHPIPLTVAAALRTDTLAHYAADMAAVLAAPGLVKLLP
jgi:hypothetical protein